MPRFHIHPTDSSSPVSEFIVTDEAAVLHMVERLGWEEADVMRDNKYSFSVRLAGNGMWTIFQRKAAKGAEVVPLFG